MCRVSLGTRRNTRRTFRTWINRHGITGTHLLAQETVGAFVCHVSGGLTLQLALEDGRNRVTKTMHGPTALGVHRQSNQEWEQFDHIISQSGQHLL